MERDAVCVGMSHVSSWTGQGGQGWLFAFESPAGGGGDLLPALQHIPHRLPVDTALLHTRSTTQDWCAAGISVAQDFPILPIFFFKCKECHETSGIEHKAGVFTTTVLWYLHIQPEKIHQNTVKLLQVPHA